MAEFSTRGGRGTLLKSAMATVYNRREVLALIYECIGWTDVR